MSDQKQSQHAESSETNGSIDEQSPSKGHDESQSPGEQSDSPLLTTEPAIQPTILKLAIILVTAGTIIGLLFGSPSLVGGAEEANVIIIAVALLAFIGLIRYLVRIFVLKRTTYYVQERAVQREFELLYRTKVREVPYHKVRSHELQQTRLQHIFGFGSVALNKGLGTLTLTDVQDPHKTYRAIRTEIRRTKN